MTTVEERLRKELRRVAGQIDQAGLRPLRAPARRRVRRRWLLPAGAVAGLGAVAGVILLVASLATGARPAPAPATLPTSGAMPRYYVSASDSGSKLYAYVRDATDGRVTGSVLVPVQVIRGKSVTSWSVVAAADDRHFVIATAFGGDLSGVSAVTLFRLPVSASGQPGKLTKVSFDNHGDPMTGLALSPDGGSLAVSLRREFAQPSSSSVEVIDLATGALQSFDVGTNGIWAGMPLWGGNGRTLMFPLWNTTTSGVSSITGVETIPMAPSAVVEPLEMTMFPAPVRGLRIALLTAGGKELIGSSCTLSTARILEMSAVDGRVLDVLHTETARLGAGGYCSVLSADPSGRHLLTQAFTFGRIDNGAFRALPGASADDRYAAAAW